MNKNRIKKICVFFPAGLAHDAVSEASKPIPKFLMPMDVDARILSEVFAGPSNIAVGSHTVPRIEGFNCTWRYVFPYGTIPQFTFASSEEKKVMRIIAKYGGRIIDPDGRLNQYEIEESLPSGRIERTENVNETIKS